MPNSSRDAASEANTTAHLESISRGFFHAFNARDLNPSSPAWQHMSANFIALPDLPSNTERSTRGLSLADWLALLGSPRHAVNSSICAETMDVSTQFNSRVTAEVFVLTKSALIPENKVMEHVSFFDFRYMEGRWQCVKFTGIRGRYE